MRSFKAAIEREVSSDAHREFPVDPPLSLRERKWNRGKSAHDELHRPPNPVLQLIVFYALWLDQHPALNRAVLESCNPCFVISRLTMTSNSLKSMIRSPMR